MARGLVARKSQLTRTLTGDVSLAHSMAPSTKSTLTLSPSKAGSSPGHSSHHSPRKRSHDDHQRNRKAHSHNHRHSRRHEEQEAYSMDLYDDPRLKRHMAKEPKPPKRSKHRDQYGDEYGYEEEYRDDRSSAYGHSAGNGSGGKHRRRDNRNNQYQVTRQHRDTYI